MAYNWPKTAHLELKLASWASQTCALGIRGYSDEGPLEQYHTTNADRSKAESTYELHGIPNSVYVFSDTVPTKRGQCYVKLELYIDGKPRALLCAGYVETGKPLTWPGGTIEDMESGRGYVHLVTGTDPAANVEISEAVPTNAIWRVLNIYFSLVTDANVANRTVMITVDDGTDIFKRYRTGYSHPATTTKYYNFTPLVGVISSVTAGSTVNMGVGELILPEGYQIKTETSSRQVGDDYSAPLIYIEEWIVE